MGRLIYLNFTRPDISFIVNHLSQFMHKPFKSHMDGALQILAYLKGTIHPGLWYINNSTSRMEYYLDADYANCPNIRRSILGYVVFFGKNLVS